jgi:hypothetical protein
MRTWDCGTQIWIASPEFVGNLVPFLLLLLLLLSRICVWMDASPRTHPALCCLAHLLPATALRAHTSPELLLCPTFSLSGLRVSQNKSEEPTKSQASRESSLFYGIFCRGSRVLRFLTRVDLKSPGSRESMSDQLDTLTDAKSPSLVAWGRL